MDSVCPSQVNIKLTITGGYMVVKIGVEEKINRGRTLVCEYPLAKEIKQCKWEIMWLS